MPLLPYPDPRVALATLHGKADALSPALAPLGLRVEAVAVDTDALGTFSSDIERRGSPRDVAIAKARLGMAAAGMPLGIATEASFGPDPIVGFLPVHHELIAFVDDVHGHVVVVDTIGRDTNWQSTAVRSAEDAEPLLVSSGFPEHALLVRPNRFEPGMAIAKGLVTRGAVSAAIRAAASASGDGLARVETDMRAHVNPTRMRRIAALARELADRLATPCPACGAPGFGRAGIVTGLPCADCGTPTDLARAERHACGACGHAEERHRGDGRTSADPAACPSCNP